MLKAHRLFCRCTSLRMLAAAWFRAWLSGTAVLARMHPFETSHPLQSVPFYRERSTRTTLGSLLVVLLLRCAALLAGMRAGRMHSRAKRNCHPCKA